jgi:hypothetical protein
LLFGLSKRISITKGLVAKKIKGLRGIMDKECFNCSEYKNCKDSFFSWIFFFIGVVATIAVRVVTVLMHVDPVYGQISWYIGIGGFFIFFAYKFKVYRNRRKLIFKKRLKEKIREEDKISSIDRQFIGSLLCALSSNKDQINYFFIFFSSAVAFILAFYFDFIK